MNKLTRKYLFDGAAKLNESDITSSRIVDCVVTELPLPVQGGDAVPLRYLRSFTENNTYQIITLSGTDWYEITEIPNFGNRQITVNNLIAGAPNASWRVSRCDVSDLGSQMLLPYSASENDSGLEISWPPFSTLRIRKNTTDYDGNYELSINR